MTPALIARFLIRSAIPIIFGIGAGIFTEWGERKLGMHNNSHLVEVSDFASTAVTLIVAYTVDALLNCCWPTNPYQQTVFFQLPKERNEHSESHDSEFSENKNNQFMDI